MSRSAVAEAVKVITALVEAGGGAEERHSLRILRRALKPRTVWTSKEVAAALGVDPSNLGPGGMRDFGLLAESFQTLPRPAVGKPDKVMRLWWADEVLEHPKAPHAGQTWRSKTEGPESFSIVRVTPERVTLRSVNGEDTPVSFRTLRGDYEQVERGGR